MHISTASPGEADRLARLFAGIASQAAVAVMEVFRNGCKPREKADRSPVSDADERAEEIILSRLSRDLPGVPVLAEESAARLGLGEDLGDDFILVDPVDGTREFVAGGTEFTVNIGLVSSGMPVAGAVLAPATRQLWFGGYSALACQGFEPGAPVTPESGERVCGRAPPGRRVALVSSSHLDPRTQEFLATLEPVARRPVGSSLKFGLLAMGEADVYPRWGPTMEWDTAAGHAVLAAAGGSVTRLDGRTPLIYGKTDQAFANPDFVAWGRRAATSPPA